MRTLKLAAIAALALAVSTAFGQAGPAPKVTTGKTQITAPKETTPKATPKDTGGTTKTVVPPSKNPSNDLFITPPSSTKSEGTAITSTDSSSINGSGQPMDSSGDTSPPAAKYNWTYIGLGGVAILFLLWVLYAVRKNNSQAKQGLQLDYGQSQPSAASSQAAGTTGRSSNSGVSSSQSSSGSSSQPSTPASTPSNTPPPASASDPTQLNMGSNESAK